MNNPEGRDKYEADVYEGMFLVRVEYMVTATKNKVIPLDNYFFRVNDNAIYYSEKKK